MELEKHSSINGFMQITVTLLVLKFIEELENHVLGDVMENMREMMMEMDGFNDMDANRILGA